MIAGGSMQVMSPIDVVIDVTFFGGVSIYVRLLVVKRRKTVKITFILEV